MNSIQFRDGTPVITFHFSIDQIACALHAPVIQISGMIQGHSICFHQKRNPGVSRAQCLDLHAPDLILRLRAHKSHAVFDLFGNSIACQIIVSQPDIL